MAAGRLIRRSAPVPSREKRCLARCRTATDPMVKRPRQTRRVQSDIGFAPSNVVPRFTDRPGRTQTACLGAALADRRTCGSHDGLGCTDRCFLGSGCDTACLATGCRDSTARRTYGPAARRTAPLRPRRFVLGAPAMTPAMFELRKTGLARRVGSGSSARGALAAHDPRTASCCTAASRAWFCATTSQVAEAIECFDLDQREVDRPNGR